MNYEDQITFYLCEFSKGNKTAFNKLFPLVYKELRKSARNIRIRFWDIDTLNTTALVHETYLKMLRSGAGNFKSKAHFYYVSAKAMRHILINASQKKRALRRGGDMRPFSVEKSDNVTAKLSDQTSEQLLMIHDALEKLEMLNDRQAKIVECRFFGGMTVEETAEALNISPSSVKRSWSMARSWLYTQFNPG